MSAVSFSQHALVSKYNMQGPRYTSYPTALEFNETFCRNDFVNAVANSHSRDLSLYIHIPFCHSLCYYCGCNKIVTRQPQKADIYLDYLMREITSQAKLFQQHQVKQLHLGGGTPTFLNDQQLELLVTELKSRFSFATNIEMSIEIDPREFELERIANLRQLGFNRLSIGVQDVNETVQEAINRKQCTSHVKSLVAEAKRQGINSVNLDLIYGLPHQSATTMAETLTAVADMDPDRISLFSYAHLPNRFAAQRKIHSDWLPGATDKLQLMEQAITALLEMGYQAIGMDHFAKPEDELAIAQRQGRLHRNFQGYTTLGECDLLGLGVSSISAIGNCLTQNHKQLSDYYNAIDASTYALARGVLLTDEDKLRGDIIKQLMCNFVLDKKHIESKYEITFDQYFSEDLESLKPLQSDGLLIADEEKIQVSDCGRLFVRNICMSFDQYIKPQLAKSRYSSIV
ncbi:oxygen-independent coproporphyrinogen III oxidase [Thalassotalea mangrovi]|uniref:Coproporphyrinogen-III oxidase n=1 Tax=Thalassotalea mangrovi TaxID=2572245 RepID=A0A4U1B846_9GAMM|nr:oxygen-independent coproporphyrinogen III oxidase [Thalassotalea mangrovi]TKB46827.1 oxygen-independent coproporphyrinogen III oxidase [Thalassotalea mangrovi]